MAFSFQLHKRTTGFDSVSERGALVTSISQPHSGFWHAKRQPLTIPVAMEILHRNCINGVTTQTYSMRFR